MKGGPVAVLVGTKKGAYIFRGDMARRRWRSEGPLFKGGPVYHLAFDARDGATVWAAINRTWGGPQIQVSHDLGKTWKTVSNPVFSTDSGLTFKRAWHLEPGHASDPKRVWLGVEPAALFWSDDDGDYWTPVGGLNEHPTRDRWAPGGGGLALHSIAIDARDPRHVVVGISAGGVYESRNGGASWRPWNEAVRAEHLPEKKPEVGQCVHKLLAHPAEGGLFFQRNHNGIYWRRKDDAKWKETTKGLPGDYGFAAAVHPFDAKTAYVLPLDDDRMRMAMLGLAVYATEDRGRTWQRRGRGLPKGMTAEVMREGLATDRLDPVGLYFGTTAGELWASRNEGKSWERIAQYLPPVLSVSAATLS